MSGRQADLPLTGEEVVHIKRGRNNARVTTQEIADLTGLDGTETVRIRRGNHWRDTTVADIRAGINGDDIVSITQWNT